MSFSNDIVPLILTKEVCPTAGGFSGLLWYLHNPLNEIYTTVGGVISNGSATGVAALGIAATAVPFVRAVSILLIVSLNRTAVLELPSCLLRLPSL